MKQPERRVAEKVMFSIRDFERECTCLRCADCESSSCVDCPLCVERMAVVIGGVLGLGTRGEAIPVVVTDPAQRPLFGAEVIEFRPREKKPCKAIAAAERKA